MIDFNGTVIAELRREVKEKEENYNRLREKLDSERKENYEFLTKQQTLLEQKTENQKKFPKPESDYTSRHWTQPNPYINGKL